MHHPLLALDHASYHYAGRDLTVLDDCSIALGSGKVGLIGPNGSGKTTLLQCLMGILRPHKGVLRFKGEVVASKESLRIMRRHVGFVFQQADDQLFSPTVLEDVAFGPLNLGLTPQEAQAAARNTLASLGLDGYEDRVCHRLSGGEKRLVALATVLAMTPELLLLDEPTNDLDPAMRKRIIHIVNELPLAMLIVSHDWDFLSRTVFSCLAMEDGRLRPVPMAVLHSHRHGEAGAVGDGDGDPHRPHLHGGRSITREQGEPVPPE
ncbi:MAG: energy-coupling factor ABC transporter ATP-binding protein [Desulfovibrio sp.]|nr:energy-coupling factor ABC transporter ATP-binding protein [Desulfovibrio sp.]MCA1986962.1 energy-coupling factor ABC transporter ATP-binding protein [Desulfovibrio sp.]